MGKNLNILYLEDEKFDVELVQAALDAERVSYNLIQVDTEDDFVNVLKDKAIDIILADYKLPTFDGLSALKIAEEMVPDIPFIFVSGTMGEEFAVEAMRKGAADYILKEGLHRLAPAVKRALDRAEEHRKRIAAEQALKMERHRLFSVLEELPAYIYLQALDHTVRFANRRFRETFGNHEGRPCYTVLAGRNEPCEKCPPFRVFDSRKPEVWEWSPQGKRTYQVHDYPFTDVDGSSLVLELGMDITEQKNLASQLQQAQKMEAIRTLAGGIAHDFNNILGAIMGFAELAEMEIPDEGRLKNYLKQVLKSTNRAKHLVRQILAFSRMREQEEKPMQLVPIITEALKMLRASIPTTIEIQSNLKRESGTVKADPTRIHQVLMNLCTNAAHAMQQTGGVLKIDLEDIDLGAEAVSRYPNLEPGPYVRLTVSDTGHGMDDAIKERIFDPYFTTKEKGVGTGLGLAVVHGIVNKHGGEVSVESEPGKGSAFQVLFPRSDVAENEATVFPESLPTGQGRILFVDDEALLVDIGRQMLERLGYEVEVRNNGTEALAAFQAEPDKFDVVITDQTMPKMTGEVLAKELLSIRPDIPIILCTGFSELIDKDKAKALGFRELAMKPLAIHDLGESVRKALGG